MSDTQAYMPQSQTVEWSTPQDLYDRLNAAYHFTIDVAADESNAKCARYYDKEADGLAQDWTGEVVWCNPPYGRVIADWVRKAALAKATTVMLIPARVDTRWFHDYIYGKHEVVFLKNRLKFGGSKDSAPFPNMVVVFRYKSAKTYDTKATMLYALGMAIQREDDEAVKRDLEDLEETLTYSGTEVL